MSAGKAARAPRRNILSMIVDPPSEALRRPPVRSVRRVGRRNVKVGGQRLDCEREHDSVRQNNVDIYANAPGECPLARCRPQGARRLGLLFRKCTVVIMRRAVTHERPPLLVSCAMWGLIPVVTFPVLPPQAPRPAP
jgi:hypothetical protein